jgi:hypothetical protein
MQQTKKRGGVMTNSDESPRGGRVTPPESPTDIQLLAGKEFSSMKQITTLPKRGSLKKQDFEIQLWPIDRLVPYVLVTAKAHARRRDFQR